MPYTSHESALINVKPFKYKRQTLACVPTVDGANPHSWNYTFDVKYDGSIFEISLVQLSTSFRSANLPAPMSILGENEELIMAAPTNEPKFIASQSEPRLTINLNARFLLRDFPELNDN